MDWSLRYNSIFNKYFLVRSPDPYNETRRTEMREEGIGPLLKYLGKEIDPKRKINIYLPEDFPEEAESELRVFVGSRFRKVSVIEKRVGRNSNQD